MINSNPFGISPGNPFRNYGPPKPLVRRPPVNPFGNTRVYPDNRIPAGQPGHIINLKA